MSTSAKTTDRGVHERSPSRAADIGARLAEHRGRRGLRVSALAGLVGVSPSLISQIERGQSRPSVSTLFALSEVLEVSVDAFFHADQLGDAAELRPSLVEPSRPAAAGPVAAGPEAERRAGRYVVRREHRDRIDIEGGVRWERLTPAPVADAEFMWLEYAPFAESHPTEYQHPGTEMVLLVAGRLDIAVGSERHELEPGDSICFASTMPHRYVNPTAEVARAVTVILPDGTLSGP